tara:strand:- start:2209 stop:2331 length:123 start_codon:yes stop_codon:yes gene_type:complete
VEKDLIPLKRLHDDYRRKLNEENDEEDEIIRIHTTHNDGP